MTAGGDGQGRVAFVTDSTAYLPERLVRQHGVTVVPLQVVIDGAAREDGVDAAPQELAEALRRHARITTSRPSTAAFSAAYARAARSGAEAVISVHLSSAMSGTYESALAAAASAPLPVHVVDSRSIGMGTGFGLLAAAEAVRRGSAPSEAAELAAERARATTVLFYVDTLEYLRRGGRIGAAQAWLGAALAMKPLLHLVDGRIVPLEKVRTASRAMTRLEELAAEHAEHAPCDVAVHQIGAPARGREFADRLARRVGTEVLLCDVGAVVGAHVGPGMLAVVLAPHGPSHLPA